MSGSCKFRFLMGCGESLQSRWWVTQPVRVLLPLSQDARTVQVRNPPTAAHQGAKCKS